MLEHELFIPGALDDTIPCLAYHTVPYLQIYHIIPKHICGVRELFIAGALHNLCRDSTPRNELCSKPIPLSGTPSLPMPEENVEDVLDCLVVDKLVAAPGTEGQFA